ncbi:MAG: TolC family protein [Deltaproteobacteria bacterium]|nr:TolC family protein [Deltaproteobacteria bacterium]
MAKSGTLVLLFFFWWWTASAPGTALGSGAPVKTWTLEEAITRAMEASPQLQASREAVDASEFKRKQVQTGFLPKVSTQYNYSYVNNPPKATLTPQDFGTFQIPASTFTVGTQNNYNFNIGLEQPIFTGFALTTNYELAKLGIDLSRIKYAQDQLNVSYQVKEAYFNFLGARKLKEVADQTVTQITESHRIIKNYYDVGLVPMNDLLKAEVQLADARQKSNRAENAVYLAGSQFNTLLRLPLEGAVEVKDILEYQPYEKKLSACKQEALAVRPEVQELNTRLETAEKTVQLAKSEYYPQVFLQGRYKKEGDGPEVSGSLVTHADNFEVLAGLKWNLWEWGRTHYLVQEKIKEKEQVKAALVQTRDAVELEVQRAFINLKEAERNIDVARKTIQSAEENFRISEVRYREQVATSLELFDAQTLLTQARVNHYRALYDYNLSLAQLQRSMGLW